jgi:hypothetical protein
MWRWIAKACGPVSLRRAIRAWKLLDPIGAPRSAAARRPEEDGLRMCPAWSGLYEAGRPQARPGAIADCTPRMPAGHFSTRSGSWWRRDRRTGCLSAPPSGPQPRSLSDTRTSVQLCAAQHAASGSTRDARPCPKRIPPGIAIGPAIVPPALTAKLVNSRTKIRGILCAGRRMRLRAQRLGGPCLPTSRRNPHSRTTSGSAVARV